jgi:hypothetical protein
MDKKIGITNKRRINISGDRKKCSYCDLYTNGQWCYWDCIFERNHKKIQRKRGE